MTATDLETVKQKRNSNTLHHNIKQSRHHDVQRLTAKKILCKDELIKFWLNNSFWSQRILTQSQDLMQRITDKMSSKTLLFSSFNSRSSINSISSFRKLKKKVASIHNTDFQEFLCYQNIYINIRRLFTQLLWQIKSIIMCSRTSLKIDDTMIQKLQNMSCKLKMKDEKVIVQKIVSYLILSLQRTSCQRLTQNVN